MKRRPCRWVTMAENPEIRFIRIRSETMNMTERYGTPGEICRKSPEEKYDL